MGLEFPLSNSQPPTPRYSVGGLVILALLRKKSPLGTSKNITLIEFQARTVAEKAWMH
jgi:hypothetical protein